MNTISFTQNGDQARNVLASWEGIQGSIYPNHHEVNITEGSEFLDDAIRVKDQPFGETNKKENE